MTDERPAARAYTLDEVDRLRDAARVRYGLNSNFDAPELEARVRTLMYAGLNPVDLEQANSRRLHDARLSRAHHG